MFSHPLLLQPFFCVYFTVASALSFLFLSFPSRWVENAPLRITIEQQRRMAGYRRLMKRRIVYSKTKDEPSDRYKQNQQEALDQWIM